MTGGAGLITNIGGGGGSGEVVISTITQDNSFETGNTVYNDNGVWKLAQANDADTLATHLITNVTSTTFDIVSIGKVEWTSHGLGTAGQILYTSETISGGLTTTEPGTYSNPVGFIFDENNIFIVPWRASATMGTSMTFGNMCRMHSGVATITGGAGDVTITVPFDWTGGYLTVIQTDTSSEYYLDATTNYAKIETTYEALTNSSYTTDQIMAYISNTTPELYIRDKLLDTNGVPKSATPTSFTLNEAGTTMYVKYFVWAPYSQTITFGSNQTMTISGSGAPTSVPVNIGDVYIDKNTGNIYMAVGTSGSYNWTFIKQGNLSGDYLTGLTSWYDASDSLTPNTNGSTLTGWNDKGSQANHLTTISGTPKYYENIQNGLSAAYFDGDNDYLSGSDKADIAQPHTEFLVFRPTRWQADASGVYVVSMQSTQTLGRTGGATTTRAYAGTFLSGASITENTTNLLTAVFNGASSSIQVNNGTITTGNAGTGTNTNNPRIGAAFDTTEDFMGYVMEWRIYSGALTTEVKTQIQNFLNNKWAIY